MRINSLSPAYMTERPNPFALMNALELEAMERESKEWSSPSIEKRTPLGKKMGVWINGKLALQTRDRAACDDLANKAMNDRRNDSVWIAPIGSFVTV